MNANPDWRDDTITTFPATSGEEAALSPAGEKCRCGMDGCPDADPQAVAVPDIRVVLSCVAGVTSRMWRARIASGEWDHIPSLFDQAHAKVHLPALSRNRRIDENVAVSRYDIAASFSNDPDALSDPGLAAGLRDLESRLAGGLAQMQADADVRGEAA